MNRLNGLPVYTNELLSTYCQVRFPRSKKCRMRKKWRKNLRNWASKPDQTVYKIGDTFYLCHPQILHTLVAEVSHE